MTLVTGKRAWRLERLWRVFYAIVSPSYVVNSSTLKLDSNTQRMLDAGACSSIITYVSDRLNHPMIGGRVNVFPVLSIILSVGAAIVYALNREWAHTAYWLLGGVLTAIVTFAMRAK